MSDFFLWVGIALLLGGWLVIVAGKFWHYGMKLTRIFIKLDVNSEKGLDIAMVAGGVLFVAGIALLFLRSKIAE
jgi:hypothetical protein